jgi:predicted transcriptional regulator
MAQSLIEIAKDLTLTLVEAGRLSSEDMQDALQRTHATLAALKAQEEFGTTTATPVAKTAPVDWHKSITKHAVVCLECGQTFKQLSARHLRQHDLDPRTYRQQFGIPRTQPLAAKTTTARRREVAQEIRPWEKVPRFIQAHEHNGHASPEPEVEALRDELEMPVAGAPPKRQRKTSPKKTARKKRSAG